MMALRRHYAGEGNSTRRIADAKKIQNTLHYKTERALPFNKFLVHCKRWSMFTIFEEENEPLTERAKVDELLTKVQNSGLVAAVAQLRYQLNTTSGISSTVAANHLSSEISQTPDYQLSRKINATNINASGRGNGGCLPRTRRRPWTRRLWRKRNQQENDILFGGGVGKVIVRGTR